MAPESPGRDLLRFSAATRAWFEDALGEATPVQRGGWKAIAAGQHCLLHAPTGSGKTLAAFLSCLDRLGQEPAPEVPAVRVLYVSPLKALAYDVDRNLRRPLEEIAALSRDRGLPFRPATVGVRTGDTTQKERRRLAKAPPEILITTPESLFLILGSQARDTLRAVDTVIVDEIHALAATKRGVHLALSLERLSLLADRDPVRVGLSATQRPISEIARFLAGDRPATIVDTSEPPALDLRITIPVDDMTAPAASDDEETAGERRRAPPDERTSIWPAIYPQLVRYIQEHTSTILFCNSRRLAERIAEKICELAGEDLCRAHHGSVSHEKRHEIEEQLKSGRIRAIAATSSLELGIDMGAVDLVIQIESPGSVARGLQRVGRAGHNVGDTSRGVFFPKFRGDLLEAAFVARGMRRGEVEAISIPTNCMDVLAQHVVSACAVEPQARGELARWIRRASPYAELGEDTLTELFEMLSGKYPSDEIADLRPRLSWDREADVLHPRRGAGMVALTNAGTIPDRGLYPVFLVSGGVRIGELDEEMVYESRPGETFLLGASTWRIEEISRDRVLVSPAPGEPGKMPFWRGDGPGRPLELGRAIGEGCRHLAGLDDDEARTWLMEECGLDLRAARNLVAYLRAQAEATGVLPDDRSVVVERFRDEVGDWRICILTPLGKRLHAPWALALSRSIGSRRGHEMQVMWSDDGVALRVADGDDRVEIEELLPDPDDVEELVAAELQGSALFASHFRENAARALLLPRRRPGQRTPLWAQRLRAENLFAVVRRYPGFPIVLETYRECMHDVFDLGALAETLRAARSREIQVVDVTTPSPSPFARSLVFSYVANFLYAGDAPLAERRAQALSVDRSLLRELLGQTDDRDLLSAGAIAEVEASLQCLADGRRARDADELHDMLRVLGDLSPDELRARCEDDPSPWLEALERQGRADRVALAAETRWIAADDRGRYWHAFAPGGADPEDAPPADSVSSIVRRFARRRGPFVARDLSERYGLPIGQAEALLRAEEAAGALLRGGFRPGGEGRDELIDADVMRRLRRSSLARLRAEIEPVDDATLCRFLIEWQGLSRPRRGLVGLRDALQALEGCPLPLSELEQRILPARVPDFAPSMLDELGATGELVWIGAGSHGKSDGRVALASRDAATALLEGIERDGAPLSAAARDLAMHLEERGASFLADLARATGLSSIELVAPLWELAWAGRITNDTFAPLRGLRARGKQRYRAATGRWSATRDLRREMTATELALMRSELLLSRYGIVSRDALAAEGALGTFAALAPVLRGMEEVGRVRRGHFVRALEGAQFAHPGAVDRLRACRSGGDDVHCLAALDPASPYGSLVPWPETQSGFKPTRRVGHSVILVGGRPTLLAETGGKRLHTFADAGDDDLGRAVSGGLPILARARRSKLLTIDQIDGEAARRSRLCAALTAAGFRREMRGFSLSL